MSPSTSIQPQQKQDDEPRPSWWRVWLTAARPHTLTASVSPVLVGHFLNPSWKITLPWLGFCMWIQLSTNLHNDYADFVKGADTKDRVGQARATQKGWLSPATTAGAATFGLILAGGCFIHLLNMTGGWRDGYLVFVWVTSTFNAVAYTGGPYPLGYLGLGKVSIAYAGLGDVFVFIYFGLVACLTGPYLVQLLDNKRDAIDSLSWTTAGLAACPVGWLGTGIIVVNNLRDRHTDVLAHKKTLAVRFGATFCRVEYTLLMLASYVVLVPLVWRRGPYLWLPVLSVPLAIAQVRAIYNNTGADLNPHVGGTARLQLVYCLLLSAALHWSRPATP